PKQDSSAAARSGTQQCVNRPPWEESNRLPSPRQKAGLLARWITRAAELPAAHKNECNDFAMISAKTTGLKSTFPSDINFRAKARSLSRFQAGRTRIERGLCEEKISTPPTRRTRLHSRRHSQRFASGRT